ncbi:MAG: IclR family transcriptional regulator [Granulosicoccus sp.]|nr:IclR family transcriptional regulator [Granulosicoccus sp.]
MTGKDPSNWYSERDIATTFVKGLHVLSAFHDEQARITLPEIVASTGFDRATTRRLVATLVDSGYVEKHGRQFALTSKVLTFAGSYLRGTSVGTAIQPVLNRYSKKLGRDISYARLADDAVVYVAQSHGRNSQVSFGFTIGSRLPLLHTALGRALLAAEDQNTANELIEGVEFTQFCSGTLMDRAAIQQEVITARDQGYALVSNEFENGISGLAVSVGRYGSRKGVVGFSAPTSEFRNKKSLLNDVSVLQECAQEIDRSGQ